MFKLDAHHHFWKYDPVEYDWIGDEMSAIRRNFLPEDLRAEITSAAVTAVIAVQARQSLEETRWLLELATQNAFVHGVVGWAPLIDKNVRDVLEDLKTNDKLVSIRHVLQGEPDPRFMLREDFNQGIGELKPLDLAYDILIFERHLPQTIEFVDRHPEQRFVVDHLAKPRVEERQISPWKENMQELARRPNVYCKLSGLATEANYREWTKAQLKPYIDTVLSAFGPRRVMFGSDWPVCLVAVQYKQWVDIVAESISSLSKSEQERVWGGTAREAYRLGQDAN